MVEEPKREQPSRGRRTGMELTTIVAIGALGLSGRSFYCSWEVSYVTNQGELYMTVRFRERREP
jgi:hypothetical protein